MQWNCLDSASIQVKGDFWVSLWAWNATLTADGTAHELHSGHQQSSSAPAGAPDLSNVVSRDQEIYLFATNATLTVPRLTGTGYTLLTGPSTTLSGANVQLEGATGRLAVGGTGMDLQGSTMALTGQTQATLSGTGASKPFTAQLTGSPDGVRVDGQVLSITTTPTASKVPWWTLFGLVAIPAALAVPLLRRRRLARPGRLQALIQQSEDRLAELEFSEADALTRKALDLDPTSGELHWLRARALAGREDYAQAMQHHDEADRLLRKTARLNQDLVAENAFHAALACVHAANTPLARKWLNQALQAKPSLLVDMAYHPELSALAPDAEPADPSLT